MKRFFDDHRPPVSRLRCVANESPWMWNSGRTLTSTSSGVNRQHAAARAGSRRGWRGCARPPWAGRSSPSCRASGRGHRGDRRDRGSVPRGRPRPRCRPSERAVPAARSRSDSMTGLIVRRPPRPARRCPGGSIAARPGVPGVQRQRDRPGEQRPQVGRQERQFLRGDDRHAVPWLDPQPPQPGGTPPGSRLELAVGELAILVEDRRPAGLPRTSPAARRGSAPDPPCSFLVLPRS